jgi:hypothetical protein
MARSDSAVGRVQLTDFWFSGKLASMKTTLEIDDDLYREAKAVAALTGRKMKDLVSEGLRWAVRPDSRSKDPKSVQAATRKLAECFAQADKLMKAAPRGPSAREHLADDRNRSHRT